MFLNNDQPPDVDPRPGVQEVLNNIVNIFMSDDEVGEEREVVLQDEGASSQAGSFNGVDSFPPSTTSHRISVATALLNVPPLP